MISQYQENARHARIFLSHAMQEGAVQSLAILHYVSCLFFPADPSQGLYLESVSHDICVLGKFEGLIYLKHPRHMFISASILFYSHGCCTVRKCAKVVTMSLKGALFFIILN